MAKAAAWQDAMRFLRNMEEAEHRTAPSLSIYQSVVACCLAAEQVEQASLTLQSGLRRQLVPSAQVFESVVVALSQKMQWRRALPLLEWMDQLAVPKTLNMYNQVLLACARSHEVAQAKNILARMRKAGIKPNTASYNAILSACASTGRVKEALETLDQCFREPGVYPDIYTYTNAIRACAKGGKTRRALSLLQAAKDLKLPVDSYCYTAAIEACAKAKLWVKALELLEEMELSGVSPSEVTYSVAISACGNAGQWQESMSLLNTMRLKNLPINLITYNAAITSLSKGAKGQARVGHVGNGKESAEQFWPKVVTLLDQMRSDGIEPDGFSYSSAISCCGSEGRWEEALELMDRMKKGGPRTQPNKIAYTAAIASCGKSGQIDHALRLFRQMKDQGIAADRVAYNALFSALRVAKRSEGAFALWDEMLGTRQSETTRIATARHDSSATPDIITVTDAIAAMSSESDSHEIRQKIDLVFAEAVKRGVVLRNNTLDSAWEIDLSGLTLPVARAAVRYILAARRAKYHGNKEMTVTDLTFITGVGVAKQALLESSKKVDDDDNMSDSQWGRNSTSLRQHVQDILQSDFYPPMKSIIPQRAQGTVLVPSNVLKFWMDSNKASF